MGPARSDDGRGNEERCGPEDADHQQVELHRLPSRAVLKRLMLEKKGVPASWELLISL
jgi:hypothetical protein